MNLTVGPHPPAVYWRRRAIVGAPLLLILVMFASCIAGGSEGATNKPKTSSAKAADPTPSTVVSPSEQADRGQQECTQANPCEPIVDPSATLAPSLPLGGALEPVPTTPTNAAPSPSPAAPAPRPCGNADVSLKAVLEKPAYASGATPRFKLVIENVSTKACLRDVGASHQELRVMAGERRVWSSDDCSPNHGSDARVLDAGEKRTYWLTWSGKSSAPGCPKPRQRVEPGTYQLLGRLGTLLSKPVSFTITA